MPTESFLTLNEKREALGFAAIELPEAPAKSEAPTETNKEPDASTAPIEVKFNPWHDQENGQFTFAGQGTHHGGAAAMSSCLVG